MFIYGDEVQAQGRYGRVCDATFKRGVPTHVRVEFPDRARVWFPADQVVAVEPTASWAARAGIRGA